MTPDFMALILAAAPIPRDPAAMARARLPEPLTDREMEVLALMARPYNNKEIAAELFLSPATVKRYASNIYQKLQVNRRRQAVEKVIALGILPQEQ